jgi:spore germination protein
LIKRKSIKKFKLFFPVMSLLLVLIIVTTGFISSRKNKSQLALSSWVVYWDKDSESELLKMGQSLKSVSFFAASFDSRERLFIPETNGYELSDVKNYCKKISTPLFLTIVNDYTTPEGASSLKDTNLLKSLLLSEESRNSHIQDIIKFALDGGYDGIEIDYEGIKNNDDLWKGYIEFCKELYSKAYENNLKMRVILEPSAPIEKYKFPVGPDYIMMAYNLYGTNTEPGPKANVDFINKLCKKMQRLEGEKWIAFATGGFDWADGKKATGITESKALELLSKYKHSKVSEDKDSECKYFSYSDEKGVNHTVWYADEKTFQLWFAAAEKQGFNHLAIWRLESNLSKFKFSKN